MFMWRRRFHSLDITALCSGDEQSGKMLDGVAEGEVRSETGQNGPLHQRDDGFACVRLRGKPHGDLFGVSGPIALPLKGAKKVKMARPPHNSSVNPVPPIGMGPMANGEQNMSLAKDEGIRLEFSGDRPPLSSLAEINDVLVEIGSRLWPLDLTGEPKDIQKLIVQPTLSKQDAECLKAHFLLSRERLLEVIQAAGRKPHVPGGGELATFVSPYDYSYPQLFVAEADVDYTRFDRYHVNSADDGTGVDEVAQMLSGRGVLILHRLDDGSVLTLQLNCPGKGSGWLLTHDGAKPHQGRFSSATPGTKMLVQVIGPARWVMRYEGDDVV
jgi:hypothetical protein